MIFRPVVTQVLHDDARYAERACRPSGLQTDEELAVTGRQEADPPQGNSPSAGKALGRIN